MGEELKNVGQSKNYVSFGGGVVIHERGRVKSHSQSGTPGRMPEAARSKSP